MPVYDVKAKDKHTNKPVGFRVVHNGDKESCKAHVESQKGGLGGHHPGYEVVSIAEEGTPAPEAAQEAK